MLAIPDIRLGIAAGPYEVAPYPSGTQFLDTVEDLLCLVQLILPGQLRANAILVLEYGLGLRAESHKGGKQYQSECSSHKKINYSKPNL